MPTQPAAGPGVPTRAEARAMLDALYAQLPAVECKGLCHDACTAIDASELERERLRERGVELPATSATHRYQEILATGVVPRCPALGPLNTCRVYDVRPFVCRAFGAVYDPTLVNPAHTQPMMCDHGCIPDGTITVAELTRILVEIEVLSVAVTGVPRMAV